MSFSGVCFSILMTELNIPCCVGAGGRVSVMVVDSGEEGRAMLTVCGKVLVGTGTKTPPVCVFSSVSLALVPLLVILGEEISICCQK